jgi:arylsulfatase A-like enzyme
MSWRPMNAIRGNDISRPSRRSPPRRVLFWEYEYRRKTMTAIRKEQHKLHRNETSAPWELFDVVNDPGEARDLAPAKAEVVRSLAAEYQRWIEGVSV